MTQRPFCVRFRSNLAWGPTLAVPTRTHTLVQLHACDHVAPVQPATCRSAGEGVPNYGFFLLRQTSRHFFHKLPSPSTVSTPTRVFFRRSTHFLGFSRSKIAKTLPGRDTTSVLCPFLFQPCVGAYVGRAHTYAKNWSRFMHAITYP